MPGIAKDTAVNGAFESIKIIDSGKAIMLIRSDGTTVRYHSNWLRNNALDSKTRDTNNGQRLISFSDIPKNTYIKSATLGKSGKNVFLTFFPEEKKITFLSSWLNKYAYDLQKKNIEGWINPNLKTWENNFSKHIPEIEYKTAKSNKAFLLKWLNSLYVYGFAKMNGCKKESGALIEVAELFGYVRETNYGKWFDVKSTINAINLAYTNLGLHPHTDNPYRDPVPTMQILYCIENSVTGGDSIVVDGFYAAQLLKDKNPYYFDLLSKYSARFEFIEKDKVHLESKRNIIELSSSNEIIAIRFNNRSLAPITDVPYEDMGDYYEAYALFSNIINDHALAVKFKLNPGECFIVDNTRVLHARTAYSSEGTRWFQGCYVDKDGLLSTISTMLDSN